MRRMLLLALLSMMQLSCATKTIFQVYEGAVRSELRVAFLSGAQYFRQDLINRYVDSVRFSRVDEVQVNKFREYDAVAVSPGFHDVTVYFSWDLGRKRELAPALVNYAASHKTFSGTLRFNALAGKNCTIDAHPVFDDNEDREDITTMNHVDFWVQDEEGNQIVAREQGRYIAAQ